YSEGYEDGKQKGWDQGLARAQKDAETNGKRDGTSEGKSDGLRVAYQEGYQNGKSTANDSASLQRGKTDGLAKGLERAKQEAEPYEARAYQDKENEYLRAPLKDVQTVSPLAKNFNGLQQTRPRSGAGKYYNPRPPSYPHPIIRDYYLEGYDFQYREAYNQTYQDEYDRSYRSAYDISYNEAYDRAVRRDYPNDRTRGYNAGFSEFERQAYDQFYPQEYRRQKDYYYQAAFDQFKNDAAEKQRGFKDGNQEASYKKGYDEGFAKGYQDNRQKEIDAAVARGEKRANDKYTKSAVLDFVGIELVDENGDGIFNPGENVVVKLVVKNYGLVGQSGLSSLSNLVVEGKSTSAQLSLPAITDQSKTTVSVAGKLVSDRSLKDGALGKVEFRVRLGSQELFAANAPVRFNYPMEMRVTSDIRFIAPGSSTKTAVAVKNRTNISKDVRVLVSSSSALLSSSVKDQVITVGAGREVQLPLELKAAQDAFFDGATLKVSTLDGLLPATEELSSEVVLGTPHKPTSSSEGLIIGGDLSERGSRHLGQSAKLDTFDLRIDGSTVSANILKNYSGKVIHVVGSDSIRLLSSSSISALSAFAETGGLVVVWNVSQDLPNSLLSWLGVQRSQATSLSDLKGDDLFRGFESLGLNARAEVLTLERPAVASLLMGQFVIGGVTAFNPLGDVVGRVVSLGFDTDVLPKVAMDDLISRAKSAALKFSDRLKLAEKDDAAIPGIIVDFKAELIGDDINTSVKWYVDKRKDSKLYKGIQTLLKAKDRRKAFGAFFPEVFQAASAMVDKTDREAALKIIDDTKSGVFGVDWDDVYCDYYKDSDTHGYCK
ncbi:MAG: hypothetical protein KDD25_01890, partial [Bdellovibrionales bacterium]|nr:hypothetical protein [Bdellovibrionales bacterium]